MCLHVDITTRVPRHYDARVRNLTTPDRFKLFEFEKMQVYVEEKFVFWISVSIPFQGLDLFVQTLVI